MAEANDSWLAKCCGNAHFSVRFIPNLWAGYGTVPGLVNGNSDISSAPGGAFVSWSFSMEHLPVRVPIAELRPTQMTVGMREVLRKQQEWRRRHMVPVNGFPALRSITATGDGVIPVVIGPKDCPYLIDRHHFVRALQEERVTTVSVTVVADFRGMAQSTFWDCMAEREWLHPIDAYGRRHPPAHLPGSIAQLADDPFRSLAGALRRHGGFRKHAAPYSEFVWASYLRSRIDRPLAERHFPQALQAALGLARSQDAAFLPGWRGEA